MVSKKLRSVFKFPYGRVHCLWFDTFMTNLQRQDSMFYHNVILPNLTDLMRGVLVEINTLTDILTLQECFGNHLSLYFQCTSSSMDYKLASYVPLTKLEVMYKAKIHSLPPRLNSLVWDMMPLDKWSILESSRTSLRELTLPELELDSCIYLSQFTGLREFSLPYSDMQDLEGLEFLQHLTNLNLRGTQIKEISVLTSLPQLSYVYLPDIPDYSPLLALPNLKSVSVPTDVVKVDRDWITELRSRDVSVYGYS